MLTSHALSWFVLEHDLTATSKFFGRGISQVIDAGLAFTLSIHQALICRAQQLTHGSAFGFALKVLIGNHVSLAIIFVVSLRVQPVCGHFAAITVHTNLATAQQDLLIWVTAIHEHFS